MGMKSSSLLYYVTSSGVRKNLIYQLLEKPMALAGLRECLDLTSADLIPRIKELENKNLIYREDGVYHLTFTGKVMAKMLMREDRLSLLIEYHDQFLNSHDPSPFPENLLDRIGELGKCRLTQNKLMTSS